MRWLAIGFVVLGATAPVAVAASQAKAPDPCVLITSKDASTALTATPPQVKSKTVGAARTCTYTVKKKTMTVQTLVVAKEAAFVKAAKKSPGFVLPIQGIGADAFSAANGTKLLVWKDGIEITFQFSGVSPFVATQQSLAKTALGRL